MSNNPNNFLASIAVFAELCDQDRETVNIISDFIKAVFAIEKKWSADSFEIGQLLKKHFDFDLPEAVVKTSLNKLVKYGFVKKEQGKYIVMDTNYNIAEITNLMEEHRTIQKNLEVKLIKYYEQLTNLECGENTINALKESLVSYLFDKSIPDHLTTVISSFIIKHSQNKEFVDNLNQIKEGLVILTGLKYTNNINEIGSWTNELNIYLDTEHLFNLANYNGEIFKRLFDEFYSLVAEVNQTSYKRNRKRIINLKYFAEVKREVDNFFSVAEKIIKREQNLTPENIAMEEICRGCSNVSDVIRKRTEFEEGLRAKNILIQEEQEYLSKPEFNIGNQDLITKYEKEYNEESIKDTLHSFTKINFLRRGVNRTSLENCKHIILTGKTVSIQLSKDLGIKNEAKDIPFVTDIYFLTNKLWFKLNKGFSKSTKIPSSFDVITKSQVALSSLANSTVCGKYETLQNDVRTGKLTKEEAENYYLNLREKAKRPEEINPDNINETIKFIYEGDIENYLKEQSLLRHQVKEGLKAKNELKKIQRSALLMKKQKQKKKIITKYIVVKSLLLFAIILVPILEAFLIFYLKTPNDTPLSIIGIIITLIIELIAIIKFGSKINVSLKQYLRNKYLKSINISSKSWTLLQKIK